MIDYAELHMHTEYSLMDGTSDSEEYCLRAHELGIETLAITDHSTCAGHRNHLKTCMKHDIKAILGCEIHFTEDRFDKRSKAKRQDGEETELYYHMIVLAKNDNGLKNLYAMERAAWIEGYYSKPRVDFELLEQFHEDLIITTACVSGPIARNIINEKEDVALKWLNKLKDVFHDDLYVELQDHNEGIAPGVNKKLISMADDNGVKIIASRDCHHADPKKLWLQEAMLILNTSPKANTSPDRSKMETMEFLEKLNYLYPERKMTFEHAEVHLADAAYTNQKFLDQNIDRPDLFSNTLEISDKIG